MIYLMTEKEFNEQPYGGNWMVSHNGKYDNLPQEVFILTGCRDSKGNTSTHPFVVIDNRTNDCLVEEFMTLIEAYLYATDQEEK